MSYIEVPLTELKAKLSEYTRVVSEGKTIIVTSNGRTVAKLTGPATGSPLGNGRWILVESNRLKGGTLPYPFPDLRADDATNAEPAPRGTELILREWLSEPGDGAILWRRIDGDGEGAVLAIPTAPWSKHGCFVFFYTAGPGKPVEHLSEWTPRIPIWNNSIPDYHAAVRAAVDCGSTALGIGAAVGS